MNYIKKYFEDILMAIITFNKFEFTEFYGYGIITVIVLATLLTCGYLLVLTFKLGGLFTYLYCLLSFILSELYTEILKKENFFNSLKEKCQLLSDDEIQHIRIAGICKFLIALILPIYGIYLFCVS